MSAGSDEMLGPALKKSNKLSFHNVSRTKSLMRVSRKRATKPYIATQRKIDLRERKSVALLRKTMELELFYLQI